MPNSDVMEHLIRIEPAIAPLAPSQDTITDQLGSFYRRTSLPLTRHSPLPVASDAPTNAVSNASAKTIVKEVIQGTGSSAIGVSSLNTLMGALGIISPGNTLAIGTAGASVTADVVSATSSQLGAVELNTDLGGTATAPRVVASHLASPLPVNQGGSGTTTPALVPGTNVTITGSWPNQTINSSAASSIPIQIFSHKNLAGTVGITANTLTTIDSITITMPASGGPWRAIVNYTYFKNGGVSYASYVTDGTHNWAGADFVTQSNLTSLQNGGMSPTTYANNAGVTFTVKIYDTGNSTIELVSQINGGAQGSYVQVAIISSN